MSDLDEAKQEKVTKYQTQELTEATSFSTPVDVKLSNGQWARVNLTVRHGVPEEVIFEDFKKAYRVFDRIANDGGYAVFVGDLRAPFPLPYPNTENQSPEQAQNQTEKKTEPVKVNGNGHALEFPCNKLV